MTVYRIKSSCKFKANNQDIGTLNPELRTFELLSYADTIHDFCRRLLPFFPQISRAGEGKYQGPAGLYQVLDKRVSKDRILKALLSPVTADPGFEFKEDEILLA